MPSPGQPRALRYHRRGHRLYPGSPGTHTWPRYRGSHRLRTGCIRGLHKELESGDENIARMTTNENKVDIMKTCSFQRN